MLKSPLNCGNGIFKYAMTLLFITNWSLFSQTYQPPVAPENAYPAGVSFQPVHSSNYLFQDVTLAAYDDGNNGQVIWQQINPATTAPVCQGTVNYAGGYSHLEVGALHGGAIGVPYVAFVAYHQLGVGHAVDLYNWDPFACTFTFMVTHTLSANPTPSRISMDCHIDYALAIGWVDAGTLNTSVFDLSSFAAPLVHTITPTIKPNDVDVAFSHGSQLYVHYVYNDPFVPAVEVVAEDFWVMWAAGVPTVFTPIYEDLNSVGTSNPLWCNIDGPDHGSDDWAYAYTENGFDISVRLIDLTSGTPPTTFIVNDGSMGNVANNSFSNWAPIPAYTFDFNDINIGWVTTDASYAYVDIQIARNGAGITSTLDYLQISNVGVNPSRSPILAYSKMTEFSIPWLYAFFNEEVAPGIDDFKHKYHDMTITSNFKTYHEVECPDAHVANLGAHEHHAHKHGLEAYPNPFTDHFAIEAEHLKTDSQLEVVLYNAMGSPLLQTSGTLEEINHALQVLGERLAKGSYVLEVSSESDTSMRRMKVIKN